jgi:hypothetical protein
MAFFSCLSQANKMQTRDRLGIEETGETFYRQTVYFLFYQATLMQTTNPLCIEERNQWPFYPQN